MSGNAPDAPGNFANSDAAQYQAQANTAFVTGADPQSVQAFAQSTAGAGFSPAQLAQLAQARTMPDGSFSAPGADGTYQDITQTMKAYQAYSNQQNAADIQSKAYATAANNQEGRDQTILTGPTASLLGSSIPVMGSSAAVPPPVKAPLTFRSR